MPAHNPLTPRDDTPDDQQPEAGFILPRPQESTVDPLDSQKTTNPPEKGRNEAVSLVRKKLRQLYATEPSFEKEIEEIEEGPATLSKHQKFLADLHASGQSVVAVQTAWHEYYNNLPEAEKHVVWQEFYAGQSQHSSYMKHIAEHKSDGGVVVSNHRQIATPSAAHKRIRDARSVREVRDSIKHTVTAGGQLKAKHHFQSLFIGLGVGVVTLVVLLFGLFNEMIIAPFIQPSRNVSATPIIVNNDSIAADGVTKVIIPKINVEIPVDYSLQSMEESVIQKGLEGGVVHYPTTALPGEQGNAAIFGHSSNNIFNPGKFKFAFVLLSKLENGDMFYLTYGDKVYAYKIFKKQIVNPSDTWVLDSVEGVPATATLITCDPPGTTRYRLVVWGEQISPDPATAVAREESAGEAAELPGPPESLWNRVLNALF